MRNNKHLFPKLVSIASMTTGVFAYSNVPVFAKDFPNGITMTDEEVQREIELQQAIIDAQKDVDTKKGILDEKELKDKEIEQYISNLSNTIQSNQENANGQYEGIHNNLYNKYLDELSILDSLYSNYENLQHEYNKLVEDQMNSQDLLNKTKEDLDKAKEALDKAKQDALDNGVNIEDYEQAKKDLEQAKLEYEMALQTKENLEQEYQLSNSGLNYQKEEYRKALKDVEDAKVILDQETLKFNELKNIYLEAGAAWEEILSGDVSITIANHKQELEDATNAYNLKLEEVQNYQGHLQDITNQLEEARNIYNQALEDADNLNIPYYEEQYNEAVNKYDEALASMNTERQTLDQLEAVMLEKQAALNQVQQAYDDAYNDFEYAQGSLKDAEINKNEAQKQYDEAVKKLDEYEKNYMINHTDIDRVNEEVEMYRNKKEFYEELVLNYEANIQKYQDAIQLAQAQYNKILSNLYEYKVNASGQMTYKTGQGILNEYAQDINNVDVCKHNVGVYQTNIANAQDWIQYQNSIIETNQAIVDAGYDENDEESVTKYNNALTRIQNAQAVIEDYTARIEGWEDKITEYQELEVFYQQAADDLKPYYDTVQNDLTPAKEKLDNAKKEKEDVEAKRPYYERYLNVYIVAYDAFLNILENIESKTQDEVKLAEKEAIYNEKEALYSIESDRYDDLYNQYKDTLEEALQRKDAYEALVAQRDEIQATVDSFDAKMNENKANQEALKANFSDEQLAYSKGSLGFYEWLMNVKGIDTTEAQNKFKDTTNKRYPYLNLGASNDATNLDNMYDALRWISTGNALRVKDGLSILKVSTGAMAAAQLNANYSTNIIDHARADNYGENLAWGYFTRTTNRNGAYGGWYDEEKALYEAGETDHNLIGHYLNIIDTTYEITGFAYKPGSQYGLVWSQTFGFEYSNTHAMNVEDFIQLFEEYYSTVCPNHYQYKKLVDDNTAYGENGNGWNTFVELNHLNTTADSYNNAKVELSKVKQQISPLTSQYNEDLETIQTIQDILSKQEEVKNEAKSEFDIASQAKEEAANAKKWRGTIEAQRGLVNALEQQVAYYNQNYNDKLAIYNEKQSVLNDATQVLNNQQKETQDAQNAYMAQQHITNELAEMIYALREDKENKANQLAAQKEALQKLGLGSKEYAVTYLSDQQLSAQNRLDTVTQESIELEQIKNDKQHVVDEDDTFVQATLNDLNQKFEAMQAQETVVSNAQSTLESKQNRVSNLEKNIQDLTETTNDKYNEWISYDGVEVAQEHINTYTNLVDQLSKGLEELNAAQTKYDSTLEKYNSLFNLNETNKQKVNEAQSKLNSADTSYNTQKAKVDHIKTFMVQMESRAPFNEHVYDDLQDIYNAYDNFTDLMEMIHSQEAELTVKENEHIGIHNDYQNALNQYAESLVILEEAEDEYYRFLHPQVDMEDIALNVEEITVNLNDGNTLTLEVSYLPENTTDDKTITWSSSNSNASVDENGVVTLNKKGTVTITATSIMGFSKSCVITIEDYGWKQNSKGYWYQNKDGSYPKSKWQQIDNEWYYFNDKGYRVTGWSSISSKWYYFDENGVMLSGKQEINGKIYYLNNAMITGWLKLDGVWYYFDTNGAAINGWKKINDIWYYFDNYVMVTGEQMIDGVPYLFEQNGKQKTGWVQKGEVWYYYTTSGAVNGWKQINSKWYYFDNYIMVKGIQTIDGKLYNMTTGAMTTTAAWYKNDDGSYYYFQANGKAVLGWLKINNKWYYFKEDYKMASNETLVIDGVTYIFNTNGTYTKG